MNMVGLAAQEGTAIFLDGLPAPREFVSSQLVRPVCLFVCLFVMCDTVRNTISGIL